MARYTLRRILQLIPVFLGSTFLITIFMGPAARQQINAMGGQQQLSPAIINQLMQQYHLNDNIFVQYWHFLKSLFTLNFGNNFNGYPIWTDISQAFPTTFKLAIMALVLEAVMGVIVGVISGIRRGGIFDSTFLIISLIFIAVPIFVSGFFLQFVFGVKLEWFPVTAGDPATFYSLILPAFVLASVSFAYIVRLTRTSVFENLTADHVRTARARGMGNRQVIGSHVLRNSLIPVVTFLGTDLGALMGGAVVTETIFNIHGVGWTLFNGIKLGEAVEVVSIIGILVMIYLFANLIVDLLYAVLDPRIRYA